jgi:hypothetical protein
MGKLKEVYSIANVICIINGKEIDKIYKIIIY